MSAQTPPPTRQSEQRLEGVKLTNGTEVEEEWQFSAAGQAGVGLAQLVEESVRARLQWRQPRHWCVFQQSGAEGDGLGWGTRLKHLTGQRANREKSVLSGLLGSKRSKGSTCSNAAQMQLCSPLLHEEQILRTCHVTLAKTETAKNITDLQYSGSGGCTLSCISGVF